LGTADEWAAAVPARPVLGRRPAAVAADEQVEIAIPVIVEPGGARAPRGTRSSRRACYLGEGAIAVVMKQMAAAVGGEIQVRMAVVIIVSHRSPHPIAVDRQPDLACGVFEAAVRPLVIEGRVERAPAFEAREAGGVDQEQIEAAVAVIVEERAAR